MNYYRDITSNLHEEGIDLSVEGGKHQVEINYTLTLEVGEQKKVIKTVKLKCNRHDINDLSKALASPLIEAELQLQRIMTYQKINPNEYFQANQCQQP